MKIYRSKSGFVVVDLEGEKEVSSILVDCDGVIVVDKKSAQQSGADDGLHSCICGDRIPLDEYRCTYCCAWGTARA